jgi:ankyrin repeat protein
MHRVREYLGLRKVNVNSRDPVTNATALHVAVKNADEKMVELLLSTSGINPDLIDMHHESPLHASCRIPSDSTLFLCLSLCLHRLQFSLRCLWLYFFPPFSFFFLIILPVLDVLTRQVPRHCRSRSGSWKQAPLST